MASPRPHAGTLSFVVCITPKVFLLVYPHTNVGQPAAASPTWSSSSCLAMSPLCPGCLFPPPSLNECFFYNSLVVRLPYSSIFWQFCYYFLKFVVFLLVVWGGKVYLPMPPSWSEVGNVFLPLLIKLIKGRSTASLSSTWYVQIKVNSRPSLKPLPA